ncbi:MAG: dihydropteroate synthase [candidate division Zixibacteria bacterium]|nr:dihydropteroate synthase [candidate division Zixibacteria bacterium]
MTLDLWPKSAPPWVMGVLNVTPDSFSDGGHFFEPSHAIAHARGMVEAGADIIDIGGESSRPGAEGVSAEEQIRRVTPVIRGIREFWGGPISVDTTSAQVASAAVGCGANWINDISALRADPAMAELAARQGCVVILMHMQGKPATMQMDPVYTDVVADATLFLRERARFARSCGIGEDRIILDPGIGFGKTLEHNLALLRRLRELTAIGYPILVGVSRKSFIGQITGAPVGDRLEGSLAAAIWAVGQGARIVRVHDVGPTRQALAVAAALSTGPSSS